MLILAIESSCDETSAALLKNNKLIKNIVFSQISIFEKYGGVVPEIASRLHEKNFPKVLHELFECTEYKPVDVTNVVVTQKPGLSGPLMVGKNVAMTIAAYLNIECTFIDHIHGHLVSPNLTNKVEYPALALIVSGGHTQLAIMKSETNYEIIGDTEDDAVGETYDKVARVLGFKYPGGPKVDQAANKGKVIYNFTMPKDDETNNFSFSGLKSQVINFVHKNNQKKIEININDVAASFQRTAIGILIKKTKKVWSKYSFKNLIVVGGVSANSFLRNAIRDITEDTVIPNIEYTGDNAAMIGLAGYYYLKKKKKVI